MSHSLLAFFGKAPVPGRVKTRLCPPLTPEQAAQLYQAMLLDVLDQAPAEGPDLALWFAPLDERRWFERSAPPGFRLIPQTGDDLGSRMAAVFRLHGREGYTKVLLRGTDSPTLPASRIEDAFAALDTADVVMCPDLDGGYNLIGMTDLHASLFDLQMSTSSVMQSTTARAHELGLNLQVLPAHYDVDTSADLQRLAEETSHALTPRTHRLLPLLLP